MRAPPALGSPSRGFPDDVNFITVASAPGTEMLSDLHDTVREAVQRQLPLLSLELQTVVREELRSSLDTLRHHQREPVRRVGSSPLGQCGPPGQSALPLQRYASAEIKEFLASEQRATGIRPPDGAPAKLHQGSRCSEKSEGARTWTQGSMSRFASPELQDIPDEELPSWTPAVSPEPLPSLEAKEESPHGLAWASPCPVSPAPDKDSIASPRSSIRADEVPGAMLEVPTCEEDGAITKGASSRKNIRHKEGQAADAAFGFHKSKSKMWSQQANQSKMRKAAERIVRDSRFEMVSTTLILASAAHIGLQTDVMAQGLMETAPPLYRLADIAFCIVFTLELALRIFAFRGQFFKVWGWGWNLFDLILISMQVIEELLVLIFAGLLKQKWASGDLLRVVRILRTVRTIRVLHVMRFANDLQLLVSCLLRSCKAFIWSLGLIVLLLYVVAVYFTQISTNTRIEMAEDPEFNDEDLEMWYGNVPIAVLSLFQGLTGGVDWNDLVRPMIKHISPWMGLWFFIYIAFSNLLVMNVVAAMFVESAIDRASKVREMQKMSHASRLFKTLDKDCSGYISFDELDRHLECAEVQEFFESIDVDASEAKCLFDLIDCDGSGEIEFNEFLSGCLRLQGPAKSMDMVVGLHHLNRTLDRIAGKLGVQVRGPIDGVKQHLAIPEPEQA